MTYSRNIIVLLGVFSIIIASLLFVVFMPVKKVASVYPTVGLQEIPGYGFQIIKISEEFSELTSMNLTLHNFEIRKIDGVWKSLELSGGAVSFNLLGVQEKSLTALIIGLESGQYDAVRFHFMRGLEYGNATLDNGDIIEVEVPEDKVAFGTNVFPINNEMENLTITFQKGSGVLSNYMSPSYHVSLGTLRIEVTVA